MLLPDQSPHKPPLYQVLFYHLPSRMLSKQNGAVTTREEALELARKAKSILYHPTDYRILLISAPTEWQIEGIFLTLKSMSNPLAAPEVEVQWDGAREAAEDGAGGDHDVPYVFDRLISYKCHASKLVSLMAKVQRGELGGCNDGCPDPNLDDGEWKLGTCELCGAEGAYVRKVYLADLTHKHICLQCLQGGAERALRTE